MYQNRTIVHYRESLNEFQLVQIILTDHSQVRPDINRRISQKETIYEAHSSEAWPFSIMLVKEKKKKSKLQL